MGAFTQELPCNLEELWALHTFLRFPAAQPDYGKEYSQQLMLDVYHGIAELENSSANLEFMVWCTEENLWEITRTVPKDYFVGTSPVGRRLLTKVMALLWQAAQEADNVYDDLRRNSSSRADSNAGTGD